MITRTSRFGALVILAALALTGCATGASSGAADSAGSATGSAADSVTVSGAWVKAVDDGMTGAFGEFSNSSGEDVTIVSASTDAAGMVELHETTTGADGSVSMHPIDGGFVIAAGGTRTLEPGADHIMLMGVTEPLAAGDEVTITVMFSDDSTLEFTAAVKDFTGANENYEGGDDMDMGE